MVFTETNMLVAAPSGSKIDSFTQSFDNKSFIGVVSGNNFYVNNIHGKSIYQYKPGNTLGSGPLVSMIYSQFDLGDATVDLKYG